MVCPQCRQENPPDARFCNACGARLDVACPACAHPNLPGSRFCNACGQALGGAAAPAPIGRFASPEAYTPRHLAERVLTSRSALEGERKQVSVLFADLKGSMELLADRDPEEARKLLDPVLDRMMEAVHRYEGIVNQVMGDGIMALFGAPLAHEDHAARACYAALRMQESVTRYGDEVQRRHGVPIQIRVGLNSGEVVVRSIGSDLHMDYTAVGQTTHLAARLEQMAKPGSVLVTAETLRLAEADVQAKRLGPVPIKGLPAPIEVFELTGAGPVRSRLHAAAARGLSPFVGRDAEMEHLRLALEQAREGHGQVVAVVGEPGVGKTRLFFECARSSWTEGWLRLEARSVSYGKATPYLPVIQLLKGYLEVEEREAPERIREKVADKILTLDDRLKDAISPILFLLDAVPEDDPARALDPTLQRGRVREAVKRLLLRETHRQPLLLIVENLHWIDPESDAFLDALIGSLPTARLLLLLSYRPEFQHGWGNKSYYTQLRLDSLRPRSAEELLRGVLGDDPGLEPLRGLLIRRTEGNPFFLEESVRSLAETRVLAGERGGYRLAKGLQSIQVPATIQALLAARIDRLPPDEKRLLQAASVIGTDVPFPLLQAIAEMPEETLRRGLGHLQAAEFLYERTLFPEVEYTFRHALTHEVAYGGLLGEQRRALHARVVEAIEALYADRLADQLDRLAHHVVRGEVWGKALAYLRPATSDLRPVMAGSPWWRGDHDRAVEWGQSDLTVAKDFKSLGLQVAANFRLGQAYHSLGDYPRAIDCLRRNVHGLQGSLVRERFDLPGLASVLSRTWLAWSLAERGDLTEGAALGVEAVEIAESADDPYSRILAYVGSGGLSVTKGDHQAAVPILERGLALVRDTRIPVLFPLAAAPLGYAYALSGQLAEALPLLEEALAQAASTEFLANHALRVAWLGEAHGLAGRPDRAAELAQQALALARQQKERGHEAYAGRLLAELVSRRDPPDVDGAETAYRQSLARAAELGMRPLRARCHLGLGRVYGRAGRVEPARAELAAAIELFQAMAMSFWVTQAEAAAATVG
ncbi:MAG: AAA family ATPase [Candidatus Rokubacteria bacterium]|nr:AAA family ATPase [Candidatus Rokubacteria bacterium]